MADLQVFRNRTNVITVDMGYDVSGDTITSQIRTRPEISAPLIAEWAVTHLTDGTDGELVFTIPVALANNITATSGYMDVKRVTGGEPVPVFSRPLEVEIVDAVTE